MHFGYHNLNAALSVSGLRDSGFFRNLKIRAARRACRKAVCDYRGDNLNYCGDNLNYRGDSSDCRRRQDFVNL